MATMKEVARRARVSGGTASNMMTGAASVSPKLHVRINRVIRQLDYHRNDIARSLKLSRTHTISVVVSDITNPVSSQLVRGPEDAALKCNHLLRTFNTDDQVEREMQVLGVLRKRRVDGILLVLAPLRNALPTLLNSSPWELRLCASPGTARDARGFCDS